VRALKQPRRSARVQPPAGLPLRLVSGARKTGAPDKRQKRISEAGQVLDDLHDAELLEVLWGVLHRRRFGPDGQLRHKPLEDEGLYFAATTAIGALLQQYTRSDAGRLKLAESLQWAALGVPLQSKETDRVRIRIVYHAVEAMRASKKITDPKERARLLAQMLYERFPRPGSLDRMKRVPVGSQGNNTKPKLSPVEQALDGKGTPQRRIAPLIVALRLVPDLRGEEKLRAVTELCRNALKSVD
jgi:hypothetical protein